MLVRPLVNALVRPLTRSLVNSGGLTDTVADFPFFSDFVADTYRGGFQIYGNNNNDGRFFRDSGNFQACYVEDASGLLVAQATSGMRRTNKGACLYPDVTFLGLQNRDISNAAWVKTNGVALKNQTGANNGVNAASSIRATSANATFLQAVTSASADRVFSAYVSRLNGVGTLEMTVDGGTTWTAVTVTGSYAKVFITQTAVTNPVYGFRVATNGDIFAIDLTELCGPQNGLAIPSGYSPGNTTAATGTLSHSVPWALDTDAGPLASVIKGAFGFYWQGRSDRSVGQGMIVSDGFSIISGIAGNNIRFGASNNLDTVDGSWRPGIANLNKVAGYLTAAGSMALCVNGGTPVFRGGGALSPSATHFVVSSNGSGNAALHGFVEQLGIGPNITFSAAGLTAMTT